LLILLPANHTTNPTNAGPDKLADFLRDTLDLARRDGGDPDVFLPSTDFMRGLAIWGRAPRRVEAATSCYGVPTEGD
jgi:hypothetical protein